MRISDLSSDVCSSDLLLRQGLVRFLVVRADRHKADLDAVRLDGVAGAEIGRASWRERVCKYVSISVVAVSLKKKTHSEQTRYWHIHSQYQSQPYRTCNVIWTYTNNIQHTANK